MAEISKKDYVIDGDTDTRATTRRRVTFAIDVVEVMNEEAEELGLTLGEYLERCHNEHMSRSTDAHMYRQQLEDASLTLKMYQNVMAEAGIDVGSISGIGV